MSSIALDTWVETIDCSWRALGKTTPGAVDSRTVELLYGPAAAEALIRLYAQTVGKLMPSAEDIEKAYREAGGDVGGLDIIDSLASADGLAEKFASISQDRHVSIGPKLSARAQVITCLAHTLGPIERQNFQMEFSWDEARRAEIFNDDELAVWRALELQVGMGVVASIWDARRVVPDLTCQEFAIALLRKYGIPSVIDTIDVFTCHWCGTAPCSCGGGKAPNRHVTYSDAEASLWRGPRDTQRTMYLAYAWANIARGGVGYGPLRALIEVASEKGAMLADEGSLFALRNRFGPLLLPQQRHVAEVVDRFGRGTEARRKALLSELADAVHWQFLYGPGVLDHVSGLAAALDHV